MDSEDRDPAGPPGALETTIVDEPHPAPSPRIVAESPAYIQVEVIGGPMDGERRRVETASFTIGRGETNDLTLRQDPTISTRHARIVCEEQHYWLEDLDSRNGTFLGDSRIRGRVLIGPGSIFSVGRTSVEFTPS